MYRIYNYSRYVFVANLSIPPRKSQVQKTLVVVRGAGTVCLGRYRTARLATVKHHAASAQLLQTPFAVVELALRLGTAIRNRKLFYCCERKNGRVDCYIHRGGMQRNL